MSVISCILSCEATLGVVPAWCHIDTNDTQATITANASYLNEASVSGTGFIVTPVPSLYNGQPALVKTSDNGVVLMKVVISGTNIGLQLL